MRSYFLETLRNNQAIQFNLKRGQGKTYYSIYAMLSYMSEILPQVGTRTPKADIVCLNRNQINYIKNIFKDLSGKYFYRDIKKFEPKTAKTTEVTFKTLCYINFHTQHNYTTAGFIPPDLIVLDEFFDYDDKVQDDILNYSYNRSKWIFNGTIREGHRKFQFPIKGFNDMNEFSKRLSLNKKLKKLKKY